MADVWDTWIDNAMLLEADAEIARAAFCPGGMIDFLATAPPQ
jgi:hypothetical protein